jgi:hypothetical protein
MMEEKKEEKVEPKAEEKPAEPEKPTPISRATDILAKPDEQRIELLWEHAAELVKELITLQRLDLVLEIVKSVVTYALSIAVNHRMKGVEADGLALPADARGRADRRPRADRSHRVGRDLHGARQDDLPPRWPNSRPT